MILSILERSFKDFGAIFFALICESLESSAWEPGWHYKEIIQSGSNNIYADSWKRTISHYQIQSDWAIFNSEEVAQQLTDRQFIDHEPDSLRGDECIDSLLYNWHIWILFFQVIPVCTSQAHMH